MRADAIAITLFVVNILCMLYSPGGERVIHHTDAEDGDKRDLLSPGDVEGPQDWEGEDED